MKVIQMNGKKYTNLANLESDAKTILTPAAFGYYASGAETETSLSDNQTALHRIRLLPRFLVDVSDIDTSCQDLFGLHLKLPVLIAPMAMQRLCHPEGELAMARAASNVGSVMILSTMATASIEEVAKEVRDIEKSYNQMEDTVSSSLLWFQIYVLTRRDITELMVHEAERLGYTALVVTVDAPRLGNREADEHNEFTLPKGLSLKNLEKITAAAGQPSIAAAAAAVDPCKNIDKDRNGIDIDDSNRPSTIAGNRFGRHFSKLIDDALTWDFIPWLKSITHLPVIVKGILAPDDVRRAVGLGVDGIIVSNHGGRQLDFAPAAVEMLPYIVEAVGDKVPVLVDGGIRRGTDVIKCLALGAKAVLVGRPMLYALTLGGQKGVEDALSMLKDELELSMALLGVRCLEEITESYLLMPVEKQFEVPPDRL